MGSSIMITRPASNSPTSSPKRLSSIICNSSNQQKLQKPISNSSGRERNRKACSKLKYQSRLAGTPSFIQDLRDHHQGLRENPPRRASRRARARLEPILPQLPPLRQIQAGRELPGQPGSVRWVSHPRDRHHPLQGQSSP